MGFFKQIWGGVKDVVNDVIDKGKDEIKKSLEDIAKDLFNSIVNGKNTPEWLQAKKQVYDNLVKQYMTELKGKVPDSELLQKAMEKAVGYLNTKEGQAMITALEGQLTAGLNPKGTTVGNILKTIGNAALKGLGDFTQLAVAKTGAVLTDKLLSTKPAKNLQQSLGEFFSGVGSSALKDWLKKNWPYVVIPFGLLLYVAVKLTKKGGYRAKSGKGPRTR